MKRWKYIFVWLIVGDIFFFTSCTLPENKNNLNLLVVENDTVSIINVDTFKFSSINKFHQPYGSRNIYFMNEKKLDFFKLNTSNYTLDYLFRLSDKQEFISFIVDENTKKLHLVGDKYIYTYNFYGIQESTIKIPNYNGFLTVLNQNFSPLLKEKCWYFHYFPDIEDTYKSSVFFTKPIEAIYNHSSQEINLINLSYPENYSSHCYGYNFAPDRININSSLHGYCFPQSDSIYLYDLNTKISTVKYFGSNRNKSFYFIKFDEINKINNSLFDEMYKKSSSYFFSNYAPLSKKFYRYYFQGNKSDTSTKIKPSYLVVYNNDLEYIGETSDSFNSGIIFDSEDGLIAISLNKSKLYIIKFKW